MSMSLEGKIAVLTGASGGIGHAIAEKLSQCGMKLVLLGGNNLDKLEATRKIVEQNSQCLALPGNLTDLDFIASAVKSAAEHFGGIDVLINNAGVAMNTPFEDVSIDVFDSMMAINVRVPFYLTQQALPYLKQSSAASIINMVSIVGHLGYPLQSIYTASKHALLGLTKSLAREYYQQNIRVHAICPGGVYTDMIKISRPDLTPDGMIMPNEIADIVHFLLANRGNAVIDEIVVHRLKKEPFQV